MLFSPEELCSAAGVLDQTGSAPAALSGGLWLVLLSSGRCGAEGAAAGPLLLEPGALLLSGEALTLTPTVPCHLVGVRFGGALAAQAAARVPGTVVDATGACPEAAQALQLLCAGAAQPTPAFCFDLLCRVCRLDESAPAVPRLAAEAIAAIRKNYASLYGVEELADTLGVSKSHLVRSFRESTGVTPGQYLTEVRLEAAKQLLRAGDLPLELVATLCGFSSANYLCRVFRARIGCTPALWRRAGGGAPEAPASAAALPMDEIYV